MRGVLLLPLLVVLYAVVAAILLPAWILSFIPFVGSSIFVIFMVIASPLLMLAQYLGFTVAASFTEEVTTSGRNLLMRRLVGRPEVIEPESVSVIRECYKPPFPTFDIVFKTGEERKIGTFSDMDVIFDWAEQQGIEILHEHTTSATTT